MTTIISGTTGEQVGTPTFTPSNPLGVVAQASVNSYVQALLQNSNSGSSASVDFVVNNDLGTDGTYYGDFGMNSSGWSGATTAPFTVQNAVYLTSTTAPLAIGSTTSHPVYLATNGTTAMTISTSQNVGIGNTAPLTKLVVGAAQTLPDSSTLAQFSGSIEVCQGAAATYRFQIEADSSATYLGSNTYYSGGWQVYDSGRAPAQMQMVSNNLDSYISFYTSTANSGNGTERMRIDKNGNLLVGATSQINGDKIGVTFDGLAQNALVLKTTYGSTGSVFAQFRTTGAAIGAISQNGASTVTYATSSDYRLKENITPMTGALSAVQQLKPCTYKWKSDGSNGQGFIAHELAEVVPDCVTGEKDAIDADGKPQYQGIDVSFLVATLTAAIQEQQAIIESLKARLDAANL